MSSSNKYQKTYSAADIEKYLRGELSPREMHDLENAALEDPFLADALDGMSILLTRAPANDLTAPADDLSRDLDDLRTSLNARVAATPGRNKMRPLARRWSIAAAFILLLGIGCAIYYTSFTGAWSKVVTSSPPPAGTTTITAPPKKETPPEPAAPTESRSLARTVTAASANRPTEEDKVQENEAREYKARKHKTRHEAATAATAALSKAMPNVTPNILPNALYFKKANSLVFSGRVLDNRDNPVPGASLTLKGYTNAVTVTDRQGQFKLYIPPQDSTRYLTVAMVGYGQKSLPLNALNANKMVNNVIHLEPGEASLDEVVVSGFGSKRIETLAAVPSDSEEELDSLWHKARPVIGRNAYLQYLDTAQKSLALDSTITGTETVSFEVDNNGGLTSFKIEQSLSPAHDEAIIRLVKEGPAWQLLQRKKIRALVRLHF